MEVTIQELKPYGVYVKTDEGDRIIAVNSDAFLPDVSGWVKIAEGYGDRYHHAQNNYFLMPIMDERGVYRYKLADGVVVERTAEEMTAEEMTADYVPPVKAVTAEERMTEIEAAILELAAMMGGGV